MKGHLTEYFNKFQEKYQELLESGKDFYSCRWQGNKDVFALPNAEVKYNKDGSVILTEPIVDILKEIFRGDRKLLRKREIFPYKVVEEIDSFTLRSLERILSMGSACVETPYSG